ncbi:NPCBM/NEW2 domain-containing protein [Kitasatospora camelliae]|uniref:NPCBM/NEW2 domain-containing protein n=1 Tax=Kitasatospora camelliae TaxID=3156397 RepID=A0AAU8JTG0_9ACTN
MVTAARGVDVPLTGVDELTLKVLDGGDGSAYDHADRVAPELTCA